jgi:hypothetical protein
MHAIRRRAFNGHWRRRYGRPARWRFDSSSHPGRLPGIAYWLPAQAPDLRSAGVSEHRFPRSALVAGGSTDRNRIRRARGHDRRPTCARGGTWTAAGARGGDMTHGRFVRMSLCCVGAARCWGPAGPLHFPTTTAGQVVVHLRRWYRSTEGLGFYR